ncbi:MAG: SpoIIE family protein phosphatase [Clostridia bacterium]|nr:SpoIIE family protein phosphatase [Clostridia bacterium]
MLQNISRDFSENSTLNSKDSRIIESDINYKEAFGKLFALQNIIIYFITFLISMVSITSGNSMVIAPFGIAMVAASISNGIPIAIVYLVSLIGTGIRFGTENTLTYFLMSVLLLVFVLIKKPVKNEGKTEQYRLGGYLFFTIIFASILKMIFTKFYLYDILVSITLSVTTYIFYKIFVNSLTVIKKYGEQRVFSIEEVVGASLLISIAVSALGNYTIFSFSIRNIICIFMVLALGWKNGILIGCVSGVTVGLVLGIIGDETPTLIAAYGISGMISGMLNRFGKIGVILGFIIGNIIIAYSANGGTKNIIMFQEILIAAMGLLALPRKATITIEDIIPNTKLLPEAVGQIEEGAEALVKLNSISQTISEMSENYKKETSFEENVSNFEHEVQKAIVNLDNNILYEYIMNNEGNLIGDLFENIINNGVLTENGIVAVLAKHNIYIMNSNDKSIRTGELREIREIIKAINSAYKICKTSAIWQKRIQEKNLNMSTQLEDVKAAIDDIANDMSQGEDDLQNHIDEITKIKNNLKDINIIIKKILINQNKDGRYIVKVYTDICKNSDGTKCPVKKIQRQLNKVLNEKMILHDQKCGIRLNKENCEFTYISEDKYIIQTGISQVKKEGSMVSGDTISQTRLGDGKYLLAISDGMGTGPNARKNSKIAISMLERLLGSGFEKNTSVNLINSAILTANKEEMYATLDIEILDLYSGKIQLLKNGACPTFIKKNRKVTMITSKSLPTGIIKNIKIDTFDKDLEDGNIIVICSDGIIESNNEYANSELWLKHLLEEVQTDSPERIADIILREAIDNSFGKAKDDMSVIVTKVIKK